RETRSPDRRRPDVWRLQPKSRVCQNRGHQAAVPALERNVVQLRVSRDIPRVYGQGARAARVRNAPLTLDEGGQGNRRQTSRLVFGLCIRAASRFNVSLYAMILPKTNRLTPEQLNEITSIVTEFGCKIQPI